MIRKKMTSRRLQYSLLIWLPVLVFSCQPQPARQSPAALGPIPAVADTANTPEKNTSFSALIESCVFSQTNSLTGTLVKDLLLVYSNNGRDFMAGEGSDGYILRVIPISQKYESVRIPAQMSIYLYENVISDTGDSNVFPCCVWQVPDTVLDQYWSKSAMLDGYTLPLHRDHPPIYEGGEYLFVVRMVYKQNKQTFTICNLLNIQDAM
jgi:hypothetical protein